MKRPQPAPITGASAASLLARRQRQRGSLDLGELTLGEMAGNIDKGKQARLARVAAEHAGKPGRALLRALSLEVGSRVGVGLGGKLPHQPPDIGHGGKALGGDTLHAPLERRRSRHRHHRRAHGAGIDQLALGEPLAVAVDRVPPPLPLEAG